MPAVGAVHSIISGPLCPDKTFIGRIERGFDFLGYHFGPEGLSVAKKTIERFVERAIRLYEQEPREAMASSRFGEYVRRWVRWAGRGCNIGTEARLVLKVIAVVLVKHLPVSPRCAHIKGHGGAKAVVRRVIDHLASTS